MLTWLHNRGAHDAAFDNGEWLVVCLHRLLRRLVPDAGAAGAAASEALFQQMCGQADANVLFSLSPLRLGRAADPRLGGVAF